MSKAEEHIKWYFGQPEEIPKSWSDCLQSFSDEQNKELRDGVKSVQVSILEMEQSSSIDSTQILYELEALSQQDNE